VVRVTSLWLVRHGRPQVDSAVPAADWPLADPADPAVMALGEADVLPRHARWVSSPEPKATATATVLRGAPVEVCRDLAEQRRGVTWFDDPAYFADAVRRAITRPEQAAVPGWEPAAEARRRVTAAVRRLLAGTFSDLVLVGHGTAWTLLVAELTEAEPDLTAWEAMAMPALCALDMSSTPARVAKPWRSVGPTS